MINLLTNYIIPGALSILPTAMDTPNARAMLLAIALQESRITYRQQINGPARGLWQFETGGVKGVMNHPKTGVLAQHVIELLLYRKRMTDEEILFIISHNDILACCFARLLLYTLSGSLPDSNQNELGWTQYIEAWRPGKPQLVTWNNFYNIAWTEINKSIKV